MKTRLLRQAEIFSGLSRADVEAVAGKMRKRICLRNEILCSEGEPGNELFVIIEGRVSISVRLPDGQDLQISEAGAGAFFGEMSMIEQAPRSATCRAVEDGVVFSLHVDDFNRLLAEKPGAAARIMQRMLSITAFRLLRTGAMLSQMVQWGEAAGKRAITDPATGMFNRRFLDDSLDALFLSAKAAAKPLSLVMLDLDRFGELNKRYGQAFCDSLIVKAAEACRAVFRAGDILIRYGGDEFVFLLPDTDPAVGLELCGQLCRAVRSMQFPSHPDLVLTCSLGLAAYPHHADSVESLKTLTDRALYRAKEAGRDRAASP